MPIQSTQNPKIQRVRALLGKSKERRGQNRFVLEGVRLIEEAMRTGAQPETLLFGSEPSQRALALMRQAVSAGADVEEVKDNILDSLSDTRAGQGLLGVFSIPALPTPAALDFVLILDSISDPGNLGAILRTAAAAGAQLTVLTPGAADAFAPKVVRAAMGAHFYLPIRQMDWPELAGLKTKQRLCLLASDMTGGQSCWQSDLRQPLALIIGSEAAGISEQMLALADARLHIPMQGKIESLNASAAASILLFEVIRQRTT
jgi:TrmH family RNA methyltransferase